jgi:hypothetical protein
MKRKHRMKETRKEGKKNYTINELKKEGKKKLN